LRTVLIAAAALVAFTGSASAAATSAEAQDAAPKIDGAKYCDAISGFLQAGTDAQKMMRDGCLENEADYAAKLTRVWTKVPETDRDSCQKILAMSQPSNQGLAGCLILAMSTHFLNDDLPGCK
jgi:hypothetical protein